MGYSGIGREGWVALSLGDRRRMGTSSGHREPAPCRKPLAPWLGAQHPARINLEAHRSNSPAPQVLIARRSCGLRSRGLRHSDRRVQRHAHAEKKDENHRDQELGQSEDHEQWLQEAINELSSAAA